jgi:hypothetical protein
MAYKQYPADKYLKEVQQKLRLLEVEKPIIDKYYNELRAKIKPSIQELPPNADERTIRNTLIPELMAVLKNSQDVQYVLEELTKSNDLYAFYRLSKKFLSDIKDIRSINSSFLLQLWSKYKSKILNEAQKLPVTEITKPDEKLKKLYLDEKISNRPMFKSKAHQLQLTPLNTSNLEQYPKGNLNKSYNVEYLAHTNPFGYRQKTGPKNQLEVEYTKTPRKGTASKKLATTESTESTESVAASPKIFDKRTGTYKKSLTATSEPKGNGLRMHPKFAGRGVAGITNYARR